MKADALEMPVASMVVVPFVTLLRTKSSMSSSAYQ